MKFGVINGVAVGERALREARIARAIIHLRAHGVEHGARPVIEHWLPVIKNEGRIRIGDRAVILGAESRVHLETREGATLLVGDRVLINAGSTIACHRAITIGDDVKIANNVAILDTGSHEIVAGTGVPVAPVVIEDDVWIGRGTMVLPGVTVGRGAVVGAGSVVTRDVPSFTVSAGSPARVLRTLEATPRARA